MILGPPARSLGLLLSPCRQTATRRSPTLARRRDQEATVSEQNENLEAIAEDGDHAKEERGDARKSNDSDFIDPTTDI